MLYRTALIIACLLAAALMIAIFYNAISAFIDRNTSQIQTWYAAQALCPEVPDFPYQTS